MRPAYAMARNRTIAGSGPPRKPRQDRCFNGVGYNKKPCHREFDMKFRSIAGKPLHSAVGMYAEECKAGLLSRREFLTRAIGPWRHLGRGLCADRGRGPGPRRHDDAGDGWHAEDPDGNQGPEGSAHRRLVADLELHPRLAGVSGRIRDRRNLQADAAGKLGGQRRRHRIRPACAQGRDLEQRRPLHRRGCGAEHHPLVRRQCRRQLDGRPHGRHG